MLTTHDLADIERLCRRLVVIDQGRIVHDGSLDDLHAAVRLPPPGGRGPRRAAGRGAGAARGDGGVDAGGRPADHLRAGRRPPPPGDLVRRLAEVAALRDISVLEPDIEDVVARLYTRQVTP